MSRTTDNLQQYRQNCRKMDEYTHLPYRMYPRPYQQRMLSTLMDRFIKNFHDRRLNCIESPMGSGKTATLTQFPITMVNSVKNHLIGWNGFGQISLVQQKYLTIPNFTSFANTAKLLTISHPEKIVILKIPHLTEDDIVIKAQLEEIEKFNAHFRESFETISDPIRIVRTYNDILMSVQFLNPLNSDVMVFATDFIDEAVTNYRNDVIHKISEHLPTLMTIDEGHISFGSSNPNMYKINTGNGEQSYTNVRIRDFAKPILENSPNIVLFVIAATLTKEQKEDDTGLYNYVLDIPKEETMFYGKTIREFNLIDCTIANTQVCTNLLDTKSWDHIRKNEMCNNPITMMIFCKRTNNNGGDEDVTGMEQDQVASYAATSGLYKHILFYKSKTTGSDREGLYCIDESNRFIHISDSLNDVKEYLNSKDNPYCILCCIDAGGIGFDLPSVTRILVLRQTFKKESWQFMTESQRLGRATRFNLEGYTNIRDYIEQGNLLSSGFYQTYNTYDIDYIHNDKSLDRTLLFRDSFMTDHAITENDIWQNYTNNL